MACAATVDRKARGRGRNVNRQGIACGLLLVLTDTLFLRKSSTILFDNANRGGF
jgi:hypothetical protein